MPSRSATRRARSGGGSAAGLIIANANMNAMPRDLRGFIWTLVVIWTLQCIAAAIYSQQKDIPAQITLTVVPAFLLETAFYVASGLRATRVRLEALNPASLATAMTISAPLPYLLYSVPTGVFSWQSLLM